MRRIAITGGLAEGKSTVLRYISDAGVPTLSSDAVAREVYDDNVIRDHLAALLGAAPTRESLREAVGANPGLRRRINKIMHPAVWDRIQTSGAAVVEVPLLLEACLQSSFSRVWVVTCGPDEQLRRLVERLGDEHQARLLLEAQLSTRVKCAFADRVIRTNEPPPRVNQLVLDAIRQELDEQLVQVRSS